MGRGRLRVYLGAAPGVGKTMAMLDEGHRNGRPITNLALQKLLYFAHALFLIERKRPLVSGYFEAWEFGPVHPAVYQSFKDARDKPITFRAEKRNLVTSATEEIIAPAEPIVRVASLS